MGVVGEPGTWGDHYVLGWKRCQRLRWCLGPGKRSRRPCARRRDMEVGFGAEEKEFSVTLACALCVWEDTERSRLQGKMLSSARGAELERRAGQPGRATQAPTWGGGARVSPWARQCSSCRLPPSPARCSSRASLLCLPCTLGHCTAWPCGHPCLFYRAQPRPPFLGLTWPLSMAL